jgi:hypothetical protein
MYIKDMEFSDEYRVSYFSEKKPRHMELVRILNTKLLLQTRYNEYSIFNLLNITHPHMLSLLLHRAFWRFTEYYTPTNAVFIVAPCILKIYW